MDNKMNNKDVLVAVFTYNNGEFLRKTLSKFPKDFPYDVIIHSDGSTDCSTDCSKDFGFKVISHEKNKGIGASCKNVIRYAKDNNYKVLALIAGNNKNNPEELERLVAPILEEDYDYVQGSRFLEGGKYDNTPLFRIVAMKIVTLIFNLLTGFKGTDATEGVRAYKLSILEDPRINIWQDWLNKYEFETYLHYKTLTLGYKVKEVPLSKIYPENKKVKYSYIRPFIDWWCILKPLFYLKLGIKK